MTSNSEKKVLDIVDKWGDAVAQRGFAQIPNYLLLINQFVEEDKRFSPIELLIFIQIAGTWWKKSEFPFPSVRTLAIRCGTSERQILRAVAKLEKAELLRRVRRRENGLIASNAYDLGPLIEVLNEIAKAYPNAFPRTLR